MLAYSRSRTHSCSFVKIEKLQFPLFKSIVLFPPSKKNEKLFFLLSSNNQQPGETRGGGPFPSSQQLRARTSFPRQAFVVSFRCFVFARILAGTPSILLSGLIGILFRDAGRRCERHGRSRGHFIVSHEPDPAAEIYGSLNRRHRRGPSAGEAFPGAG